MELDVFALFTSFSQLFNISWFITVQVLIGM